VRKKVLFTLPFAGGNKFSFREYDTFLKDDFDIYPLELPGRGERFSEELITDIYLARDDLFKQIEDHLDRDYVIYGHSLGGLLAYLLTLLIEEKNLKKPLKLVISGRANPSVRPKTIKHTLAKDIFIDNLKKLGGMPSSFFKHPELFELFEPILRADFQVLECFDFHEKQKLNTKLSILYGDDELFSSEEAIAWSGFTEYTPFECREFKGNHFFIYNHIQSICEIIKET
jgi:surfactin synthase thioesterase subunit